MSPAATNNNCRISTCTQPHGSPPPGTTLSENRRFGPSKMTILLIQLRRTDNNEIVYIQGYARARIIFLDGFISFICYRVTLLAQFFNRSQMSIGGYYRTDYIYITGFVILRSFTIKNNIPPSNDKEKNLFHRVPINFYRPRVTIIIFCINVGSSRVIINVRRRLSNR